MRLNKENLLDKGFVVNGNSFELYFSTLDAGIEIKNTNKNLKDCYAKPSYKKLTAFEYWKTWFYNTSTSATDWMCVDSYNTYMFTIVGKITIEDMLDYYFYISPTKQLMFLA